MKLSVIVPAYNEEERLIDTLKKIKVYLDKQEYEAEVIVVDDGSKDKTAQMVKDLIGGWSNFQITSYQPNCGKGYAVKTGMLSAKGDWRLMMDADNSTDISEIEKLNKFQKDYEIISGSRYLQKDSIKTSQPLFRRIISRCGNLLVKIVLGVNSKDTQCGFKLFSAAATNDIFPLLTIDRWGFDMEIYVIAKSHSYKIKEVAVDWYNAEGTRVKNSMATATLKELFSIKKKQLSGKYRK